MSRADPVYPRGSVRMLLDGPLLRPATREALRAKLHAQPAVAPAFLTAAGFATLRAACARLVPQAGPDRVDIAGILDGRLARGERNGWRYDALPEDDVAVPLGLMGLDETAEALFGGPFADLPGTDQDAVLRAVEAGDPPGDAWRMLSAFRWFEELLVEVVEIFYAHPFGQEEIGYAGMADARGWSRIGLDERHAHEPAPLSGGEAADAAV